MKRHHHHHQLIKLHFHLRRHYATKYTAKVTSTSPTGRSLSAEVTPLPSPYPTDTRGYPIPRRHVVCKATQILLHNHNNPSTSPFIDLSDYLHSLSLPLTPTEASEILKSLNHPPLALSFFRFCPSLSPDFQHDSLTYTRLLLILSNSSIPNRPDLVRSILSQMDRSNTRGTISTVNILIGFFGKSQDLDHCLSLVRKWKLSMNPYTYKCLLQAYLRSHDSNKAFAVYNEMRRRGYKLDIFAYNMLLDALAKDEKVCILTFSLFYATLMFNIEMLKRQLVC
jgi:pentatricopeptide repeat protein